MIIYCKHKALSDIKASSPTRDVTTATEVSSICYWFATIIETSANVFVQARIYTAHQIVYCCYQWKYTRPSKVQVTPNTIKTLCNRNRRPRSSHLSWTIAPDT